MVMADVEAEEMSQPKENGIIKIAFILSFSSLRCMSSY